MLLVAAGAAAGLGARGTALAIVLAVLVARRGSPRSRSAACGAGSRGPPWAPPALAALFAAIPFIAAGTVGILGVGLVNDDMASHLLLADWIVERFRPEPVLIDQGYPLGPHALVAGLGTLLGASSIDVFAGLVLAIPALTALVAYEALDGLRTAARVIAAALVSLPYLAAAYLAQEAFKEPIMALFVLTFALLLARAEDWRDAIPLGLLAAGVTLRLLLPGPGVAGGSGPRLGPSAELCARSRARRGRPACRELRVGLLGRARGGGGSSLLLLALPELGRLQRLRRLPRPASRPGQRGRASATSRASSPAGGARASGRPSEFRLSAAASSLPAALFYLGGAFALVCLALALPALGPPPRRGDPGGARRPPPSSTCSPVRSAPSTPRPRRSRSPPR